MAKRQQVTLSEVQYPAVLHAMFRAEVASMNASPTDMSSLYWSVQAPSGVGAFPWTSDVEGPKEWVGTRSYARIREVFGQLHNKDWSNGLLVDRKVVRRRGIGVYRPNINMMAMRQRDWKDQMAGEVLPMLNTLKALDGQNYFLTDKTVRGYVNQIAGRGVDPANLKADMVAVRIAMMRTPNEGGDLPRNIVPDTVICPPELYDAFEMLRQSAAAVPGTVDGSAAPAGYGVANTAKAYFRNVIPNPQLTDTNDWYFACTSFAVKPLIYQWEPMENGREVYPEVDMTKYVSDGHIGYAFSSAGIIGPGLPWLMWKVVNS